jgi:hypothetical protein
VPSADSGHLGGEPRPPSVSLGDERHEQLYSVDLAHDLSAVLGDLSLLSKMRVRPPWFMDSAARAAVNESGLARIK